MIPAGQSWVGYFKTQLALRWGSFLCGRGGFTCGQGGLHPVSQILAAGGIILIVIIPAIAYRVVINDHRTQ